MKMCDVRCAMCNVMRVRRRRGSASSTLHIAHRTSHIAFTLVELLVVIAIIALLIAILLPSLNKAREMAKGLACMTQEHQMALGLASYAGDHGGYYPANFDVNGPGYDKNTWMYAIWTYVGYSPSSHVQTAAFSRSTQLYGQTSAANHIFYCPVTRVLKSATPTPAGCVPSPGMYAYGMNATPTIWSLQLQGIAQWPDTDPTKGYSQSIRLPQRPEQRVRQPAATDLIIDCTGSGTGYWWNWPGWGNPVGAAGGVIPHLGGANATYFDLHGQWLAEAEFPLYTGNLADTPVFWKGQ